MTKNYNLLAKIGEYRYLNQRVLLKIISSFLQKIHGVPLMIFSDYEKENFIKILFVYLQFFLNQVKGVSDNLLQFQWNKYQRNSSLTVPPFRSFFEKIRGIEQLTNLLFSLLIEKKVFCMEKPKKFFAFGEIRRQRI